MIREVSLNGDWTRLRVGTDLTGLGLIQRLIWTGRLVEEVLDIAARSVGFRARGDYEVAAVLLRSEPLVLTSADLAEQLMISPSGVTGRLDRLERDGLIQRSRHPDDRRYVRVQLTDEGRQSTDRAFEVNVLVYDMIAASLPSPNRVDLMDALGVVLTTIESISKRDIEAVVASQGGQTSQT